MTAARSGRRSAVDLDRLAALEDRRDHLLKSLDDLDTELAAGDIDADTHRRLKDQYTAEAAEVIAAVDAGVADLPSQRRAPLGRRLVVATALAVIGVVAGLFLMTQSGSRLEGDTLTGTIDASNRTLLFEADQALLVANYDRALTNADEVLTDDPTNALAHLYRGEALLGRNEVLAALQAFDQAIELAPDEPETTARAVLGRGRILIGLPDPELQSEGLAQLDRAVALSPDAFDAWLFRGFAYRELRGDDAEALRSYRRALALDPPDEMFPVIERAIQDLESALTESS